jgi:hypothetical protein
LAGSFRYRLEDAVRIRQNLIVPESENSIATFFNSPAAKLVSRFSIPLAVLSAVELNYQMAFLATKISYESANRELAAKSQAIQAPRAETKPECEFSISLAAPQMSRASKFQCDWPWIGHYMTSPLPSPWTRRGDSNGHTLFTRDLSSISPAHRFLTSKFPLLGQKSLRNLARGHS